MVSTRKFEQRRNVSSMLKVRRPPQFRRPRDVQLHAELSNPGIQRCQLFDLLREDLTVGIPRIPGYQFLIYGGYTTKYLLELSVGFLDSKVVHWCSHSRINFEIYL